MPHDAQSRNAQQRRTAHLGVVHAALKPPERPARQQVPEARRERPLELLAQQRLDHLDEPLADLERNVAGEAVADDDVGQPGEQVARLDVADETRVGSLQAAVGVAGQLVALRRFLAD